LIIKTERGIPMEMKIFVVIFVILFILPHVRKWYRKLSSAIQDANNFRSISRPQTLWVDTRTNTWQNGFASDQTIWWRVFFNSLKGKPL
jgi:hypothetical protein